MSQLLAVYQTIDDLSKENINKIVVGKFLTKLIFSNQASRMSLMGTF